MPRKKSAAKKAAASKAASRKVAPAKKGRQGSGRKTDTHTPDTHMKPARRAGFPVVGIGASAGGLEALDELLQNTPPDTGMAFVVVTHQHPDHTSLLPELLAKQTAMPVVEAADGMRLKPNHVYIGPAGGNLAVLHGVLHRMESDQKEVPRLPIDYFFRSLAEDQKERAICIVLSGTGTDGTVGLRAIKREAGMAMVQQPQSAKYAGMPSSAIATGLADYVLPAVAIPKQLVAYGHGAYLAGPVRAAEALSMLAEPMQKIIVLLRSRTGHDFSAYKDNTIRRRIGRRMNVHQIKLPGEYVRFLQGNPHELDVLFKELLISVTNFFRDPEAWKALQTHLEALIKARPENHTVRAWVPGCATGEEVFSLAIVLRECMERTKRRLEIQIFGTDLDTAAIDTARGGEFPTGIAADVSPKRLERYFVREASGYRIRKEIREMAVFAPQNVIKDPPFTRLDLISCRNLLIYLNADLQKRLLPIFHYALNPAGLLLLGPSETIGSFTDLFQPLDKRWKIFCRLESATAIRALPEIPAQPFVDDVKPASVAAQRPAGKPALIPSLIERLLLSRFAPPSVVVNEGGEILFIHGRTGAYLEPFPGEPRQNVLEMAREGLQIELAVAMREALRTGSDVSRENIRVKTNGEFVHVNLAVCRIEAPEALRELLLVTFHPAPPSRGTGSPKPSKNRRGEDERGEDERGEQLGRELQHMKQSHQRALEELETSNEELQSANEELQSTNEELETSKEEMQSLNEELTTVNAQLQSKLDELSQSTDDMQNLLNSTDIATVFLDNNLNIKRFTEQATQVVTLRPGDVGRPLTELASNLKSDDLAETCREVLRTLVFKESEVETNDGGCLLMRIMPYRTADNVIDGLVLTFVNIKKLWQAGREQQWARAYFESIVDTVREPLVVLNSKLRVVSANHSFYRTFRTTAQETEGELIYELGAGQWDIPALRRLLEEILPKNSKFEDYEMKMDLPTLGRRSFLLNARRLEQPGAERNLILLALEDTTGP